MVFTSRAAALVVLLAALVLASSASAASTTVLGLRGIGPLHLGMSRSTAVATGWLDGRGRGCELASPAPVTYRFTGHKAPIGLRGSAEFNNGRLTSLSFTRGVRTATGVHLGTSPARMVARYRSAGFSASAQYESLFGATFVTVKRSGQVLVGGLAPRDRITILAVPAIPVCE